MYVDLSIITNNIKPKWHKLITKYIDSFNIVNKLTDINKKVFPNMDKIFETFKYFDIDELKVVILGQDCYINSIIKDNIVIPQANGFAFSVTMEHKIPPSLKNIYKELQYTVPNFIIPKHGDISRWVKEEKILLLNSALTVEENKSGSHMKIWEPFTDKIIEEISINCNNIVFILWGNHAKSKIRLIDQTKHHIIMGVHPSPLSAKPIKCGTDESFFGHDYFSNTNMYLDSKNIGKINWNV